MSGIFPSTASAEPNIFIWPTSADSLNKKFKIRRHLPQSVTVINILRTPLIILASYPHPTFSVIVSHLTFLCGNPRATL